MFTKAAIVLTVFIIKNHPSFFLLDQSSVQTEGVFRISAVHNRGESAAVGQRAFWIYLTSTCQLAKGRFLENGYKKTLHLKKLFFFLDAM
ncbi:hypothetical protein CO692_06750 [Enterococcus sp. FDAARGOS_375]|nr:hypothetical protein CO692_06750 [Enterococcus sp. FDAARGOS_375]